MSTENFSAFRIHADRDKYRAGVEPMKLDELSPGEVVVKVAYSSVNYKDALAGTGKALAFDYSTGWWRVLDIEGGKLRLIDSVAALAAELGIA